MPTWARSGREDAAVGEHHRNSPRSRPRSEPADTRTDCSTDRVDHVAEQTARRIERRGHRIELERRDRRVDPHDLGVAPSPPQPVPNRRGRHADLFGYRTEPQPRNRGKERCSDRFDAVATPRVRPCPRQNLRAATRAAPTPVRSMRFARTGSDPHMSGTRVAPAAKPTVATFVRTRDEPCSQSAGGVLRIEHQ
jgi:hypothetical protein